MNRRAVCVDVSRSKAKGKSVFRNEQITLIHCTFIHSITVTFFTMMCADILMFGHNIETQRTKEV